MRAVYTGHQALTFTDYIDQETGRTLHAEPGQVYDVAPASGRLVGEVPEPWFVPVDEQAWAEAEAAREAERLAAEDGAGAGTEDDEPAPDGEAAEPGTEPGTEEGQSF